MVLVWRITDDSPNLPNISPAKLSCYAVIVKHRLFQDSHTQAIIYTVLHVIHIGLLIAFQFTTKINMTGFIKTNLIVFQEIPTGNNQDAVFH